MTTTIPATSLQLRSLVKRSGELELSLARIATPEPADDEVLVRIEGTPINPSDLGLLLGPADIGAARASGTGDSAVLMAPVPKAAMKSLAARLDESMPVGNEGAGIVVKTGAAAKGLLGKTVGVFGGAMYAQYRVMKAAECLVFPDGVSPAQGASGFVNPLTALGMTETMRRDGHTALVHTAAASNLGQMLNRICLADGIGLVNIVRSAAQQDILHKAGAVHVCDTSRPSFREELTRALIATGATIAFDAIGGGTLAGDILSSMEDAVNSNARTYNRYGSSVHKQVYIYGRLDPGPTHFTRDFGSAWGIGGWLLMPFLHKIGPAAARGLSERVAREITTTFASHYTQVISLHDVLRPDIASACNRRATGEKFLINPNKP